MHKRINENFRNKEDAQKRADELRRVDPATEAYIYGPFLMEEYMALTMYGLSEIWTVTGDIYRY